SEEDSDPEQARRDKDMKKNLALLAKTLEKESRSKLDKDKVKPYNYTYQNSLYETFKPLLVCRTDEVHLALLRSMQNQPLPP
ncbi:hypothetical protein Tco_0380317, partial [Tanacetum coccineum]